MRENNLIFIILLLLIGCASSRNINTSNTKSGLLKEKETQSTPENLDKTKWKLLSMKNINVTSVHYDENRPWIIFDIEKSMINGYNGCNRFGGTCTFSKDSVNIGVLMSTKRYCQDIPETEFMKLLESVNIFQINNSILKLKSNDEIVMTFSKATIQNN